VLGLKPGLIGDALRGAEAPLFHVTACFPRYLVLGRYCAPLFASLSAAALTMAVCMAFSSG
jgi:hypothetical protein